CEAKREIEERVGRLAPKPRGPRVGRQLPERGNSVPKAHTVSVDSTDATALPESSAPTAFVPPAPSEPRRDERRARIAPLAEDIFKFQFTASRACHEKFRQAQELLRHRVPNGDVATIFEKALDLLIEKVKNERFAAGRK